MKKTSLFLAVITLFTVSQFAQGFKVKASGEQTFNFSAEKGSNQASFFSGTPLEDITGISNEINGHTTFNVSDIKTLKGKVTVTVGSIKTGIDMRDGHLQSANWLDADAHPEISFEILKVSDVKSTADNRLTVSITGKFTVHGVIREVNAEATLTYLDESEQTKALGSGDLLGVQAKFTIKLSDYGINNKLVGQKVAENVEVSVNIVGTNAK